MVTQSQIEFLYSSKAIIFPLGFKMHLVSDHWLLTNIQAKVKAASLQAHQARFLSQMETFSTWELATLKLNDRATQANLCQFIMNIPDPVNPKCKLFHAVNKMFSWDRHIFRFHPSWTQHAWEVVVGLLVFLMGLRASAIETMKFHKFFTDGAIKRAKDAWWDTNTLSVVTKADQEMVNILTYITDLIFPETKLEMDMSGATTPVEMIAKIQENLLSTGSISTFQTTATRASQGTKKSTWWTKTPTALDASTTDTDSVFSLVNFSEQDLSILLAQLVQAMTLHQKSPPQNQLKKPTSGQNTGSKK